ncbi:MAG: L-seryl-tRNA(Sec) selenium transferase [Candidatus Electrothrix sp. GW3-4]|uniref:L-seryl-tRNA(Sec) selenium transferase n=1 Tax=Candidatus Electrothrix sp. GW3-4 TaxID=3126740 RepID=UPI0030CC8612
MDHMQKILRLIPSVDDCLLALLQDPEFETIPSMLLKKSIRDVLDRQRRKVLEGHDVEAKDLELPVLLQGIQQKIRELHQPLFRRVINGTGVIIHTNLGRSILPGDVLSQLSETSGNYSNLEFNLTSGERGSRYTLVEELLCELTGAEAALVVNNNAAAVLIALDTLARGKEVIVSRGQLVEIGGSFRIPDVMARSGAKLVEVGATNRTHLRDYSNAMSPETGLLLKVHTSNYCIIGFTSEVSNKELVSLGKRHQVPVMEDLGSGCLVDLSSFGLKKEPTVQEVVASGMDIVTFSGDKLLGGPQAGIILGSRDIIERIKRNPLNRALRIDKFTLSALESILRLYRDPQTVFERVPTLNMISAPIEVVQHKAEQLAEVLEKSISTYSIIQISEVMSRVGGGAMPEQNLPSRAVILRPLHMKINHLEAKLRSLDIPIIGRVENDHLLLDMRTVRSDELHLIAKGLDQALTSEL